MNEAAAIAVIFHGDEIDISWVGKALESRVSVTRVRAHQGDPFPDVCELSGVISLGGPQHIWALDRGDDLDAEALFLEHALEADRPVLGICLGSQLLASVLGGTAIPGAKGPECGPIWVDVDPDTSDPVLAGQSGVYMSFHQDSFTLPDGAELIAWSDRYPQAYRLGKALGIQIHPEMSVTGIARFGHSLPEQMRQGGAEPETMMEWARHHEVPLFLRNKRFFDLWITHDVMAADDTEAVGEISFPGLDARDSMWRVP